MIGIVLSGLLPVEVPAGLEEHTARADVAGVIHPFSLNVRTKHIRVGGGEFRVDRLGEQNELGAVGLAQLCQRLWGKGQDLSRGVLGKALPRQFLELCADRVLDQLFQQGFVQRIDPGLFHVDLVFRQGDRFRVHIDLGGGVGNGDRSIAGIGIRVLLVMTVGDGGLGVSFLVPQVGIVVILACGFVVMDVLCQNIVGKVLPGDLAVVQTCYGVIQRLIGPNGNDHRVGIALFQQEAVGGIALRVGIGFRRIHIPRDPLLVVVGQSLRRIGTDLSVVSLELGDVHRLIVI